MKNSLKILIEVSPLEAALLYKLRKYAYGKFTVYKIKDEPKRVEIGGSEILNEKDGLKLSTSLLDKEKIMP